MSNAMKSTAPAEIFSVPCERVRPFKNQPRKHFDAERIRNLKESIAERGQLEPALVRRIEGPSNFDHELVSGEYRWRACKELGIQLRVTIVPVSDAMEQFVMAVIANSGEPLTPMETCHAMHELRKTPEIQAVEGQKQVAAIARLYFNHSSQWAWERWGLHKLDESLQSLVEPHTPEEGRIPVKIAASLTSLPRAEQASVWEVIKKRGMTVVQARSHITKLKRERGHSVKGKPAPDTYRRFLKFTRHTIRDLEPFLDMLAGDLFQCDIAEHSPREIHMLDGELQGLIERLQNVRSHVIGADQRWKAS